ncbi:MAG TPA: GNAT family N-acetyltransferase [Thermoanaerobaculia bacterium]|jgi:RimJ/RimL family protein N-acetyltransferase|nr:GNAT family N-acetyltransferase [Thermoanaerobaculia bacterium]
MAYGWEGETVRLVPLDKAKHLENAVLWLNDPEITAWTLVGDQPMSRLTEEDFFEKASRVGGEDIHFAIETLAGEHIGFSTLHRVDRANGAATSGTLLGRRDLWGQGYGTDAARVRNRYAFEVLGLRMLLSEVMADNAGSLRMLTKAGYREVGRIPRRFWKRGAFRDVVILLLERPAPSI